MQFYSNCVIGCDLRSVLCKITPSHNISPAKTTTNVHLVFVNNLIGSVYHRQPKRNMCGFGLQRSFGRNILELLVYYLMLNKRKNLKDMKSSCLSICTSNL